MDFILYNIHTNLINIRKFGGFTMKHCFLLVLIVLFMLSTIGLALDITMDANGGNGDGGYAMPEFPPTLQAGPFPLGTEPVRNDAPVDETDPNEVIHEYTIYKGTPTVDGNVDEAAWNAIPWTLMEFYYDVPTSTEGSLCNNDFVAENWDGWEDFTAWFKLLHDDENVYLTVMKYDDDINYDPATRDNNGNIWQNDAYQLVLDMRYPGDFEEEMPGTEIGVCLVDEEEVYNYWSSGQPTVPMQLELADGDCESTIASATGKAIHGKITDTADGYMEVMEMAFIKWDDMMDGMLGMLSICALDRDYDIRESVTQWAQGLYVKTTTEYGSVLWSSEAPPASAVENDMPNNAPYQFVLEQNYPNPFNPYTNICYSLARQETVSLVVYNLLGEQIATLVDNQGQAAGNHKVTFDASSLTSGVYLYQLETSGGIFTQKMTVLK